MIPVVWLSVKQTGVPIPQLVYGKQLEKVTARGEADRGSEGEGGSRHLQEARGRCRQPT
jgi:cation/acetate symporter